MSELTMRLEANRSAVEAFSAAIDVAAGEWTTPRAPGKWSPSQLVEHLARSYEQGGNVVTGEPTLLPTMPAPVRPLMRVLFFNRIVMKGAFPKTKTMKGMDPDSGAATPAEGRARFEAAAAAFEHTCTAQTGPHITSGAFGRVRLSDYVRFMELHTRHHLEQMPEAKPDRAGGIP